MIKNMCLVLLCLFAGISFYRPIEVSDVGWHLATGQWILTHAQVPHSDLFAITADPSPWVFTQWLGSALLAVPYLLGGPEALKIFRAFILLLPVLIFIFYSRLRISLLIVIATATFMIYGLGTRCLARSFIFNFTFISLLLIILFSFQKNRLLKQLYILPVIGLIWGNIHLGSFVYGGLILFSFFLSTGLSLIKEFNQTTSPVVKNDALQVFKHVVIVCFLYFIFLGVTPYGWEGFLYPYKVFLMPHYINFYQFTFSVAENLSPTYVLTLAGSWFSGLAIGTLASLLIGKKKDLFSIILFILSLFLFIAFGRGSGFFVLVCSYIIVDQISSGIFEKKIPSWLLRLPWLRWVGYSVLILILSLHVINIVTKKAYLNGRERRVLLLNYIANHPKDSVDFLKDLGLGGNVFCNDHIGSYIVGAQYPFMKTLIDGRQVDQRYFRDYLNVTDDPPKYWQNVQNKYNIVIVLLDASLPISLKLAHYLNAHNDWQMINVDNTFVTFIKRGVFSLPLDVNSFQESLKIIPVTAQENDEFMNLMLNHKFKRSFFYFSYSSQFVDSLEEGVTLLELGYEKAAIKKFVQSLKVDPQMVKQALAIESTP
jgi:hypothetical protein